MFSIYFAILFIGITALSAQIVLVREFIIFFHGNELSIGIILASWLLWSSVGSLLFGRLTDRIKKPIILLMTSELLLVFLFIGTFLCLRFITPVIHSIRGQIVSLQSIMLYSFSIPALFCLLNGFLFSLGCRILQKKHNSSAAIGRVYLLEALGSAIGGILTSFILIKYVNTISLSNKCINFVS